MLRLVGWLYGRIINIRNSLYDRGVFKSHSLGARTISIGNITTGGTGKTPLVAYVAEILAEADEKVCILTRGYGRESSGRVLVSDGENVLVDARTGGDEPVELARKLIGKAIVVADADRVSAAAWAKEKFGITAFVLDDGFQHRRAKRDLDIVCVDATNPFGDGYVELDTVGVDATNLFPGGHVLPAGKLREPLGNIARADAIVITRADLVKTAAFTVQELANHANRTAKFNFFSAALRVGDTIRLEDFNKGRATPVNEDFQFGPSFAFSALGNPESFSRQLAEQQFVISGTAEFRDHHIYQQFDIVKIEKQAAQLGAKSLITTAKDAVKLTGLEFTMPCFVFEIALSLSDPVCFRDLVLSV